MADQRADAALFDNYQNHPAQKSERTEWVDVARGLGIILVVVGHSLGGMISAGQIAPDGAGHISYVGIYTFHMPLFFFLGGLFIVPRVNKDPRGLITRSIILIAFPYFLWGAIQSIVIALSSSLVTAPTELNGMLLVRMLWSPPSQFWFLYSLFLLQLLSCVLVSALGALRFLLLAVVGRLSLEFLALPDVLDDLLRSGIFFALGAWLGPAFVRSVASWKPAAELVLVTALCFLVFAYDCLRTGGEYAYLAAFPAALSGSALTIMIAANPPSFLRNALIYLGQRSMPIYLLHIFLVAGVRIVFVRVLHIDQPLLTMCLAVLAGLALPLAADYAARRMSMTRVLGFG